MNKNLLIFCLIIVGAILFWFYRQGQLGIILPYFLIALCPIMHLFLMKDMHQKSDPNNNKKHSCH